MEAFGNILSLQQSRCKIYDRTRQTEYQIHVQEGRVHSRHASSHQAVGIACTAIQITLLLQNLMIITIIWYLNCVFSIFV